MELKYSEKLVDIVEAANTSGWLEAEGKIILDTDENLTEFLIHKHNEWEENNCGKCFSEYIVEKLLEVYGVK